MPSLSSKTKVFFILTFILQSCLLYVLRNVPPKLNVLHMQMTWKASTFAQMLAAWTPEQRQAILSHYNFDFFYPICYSAFFYYFLKDLGVGAKLRYFVAAAGIFDIIENILHIFLITHKTELMDFNVSLAATASACKWILIFLAIALIISNLGKRLKQRA